MSFAILQPVTKIKDCANKYILKTFMCVILFPSNKHT